MTALAIFFVASGGKLPTAFEAFAPVSLTTGAVRSRCVGTDLANVGLGLGATWGLACLSFMQVAAELAGAVRILTGSAEIVEETRRAIMREHEIHPNLPTEARRVIGSKEVRHYFVTSIFEIKKACMDLYIRRYTGSNRRQPSKRLFCKNVEGCLANEKELDFRNQVIRITPSTGNRRRQRRKPNRERQHRTGHRRQPRCPHGAWAPEGAHLSDVGLGLLGPCVLVRNASGSRSGGAVGILTGSAWGTVASLIADEASWTVTFFVTYYELTKKN